MRNLYVAARCPNCNDIFSVASDRDPKHLANNIAWYEQRGHIHDNQIFCTPTCKQEFVTRGAPRPVKEPVGYGN